jgi:hypothetical protein
MWYDATFARVAAMQRDVPVLSVPLRENEAFLVSTLAPPIEDIRLNVVLNGMWDDGDGKVVEREVSFFVTTRIANFAFTYTRVLREPIEAVVDIGLPGDDLREVPRRTLRRPLRLQSFGKICCGVGPNPGCRYVCEDCTGEEYTCCLETEDPGCGWCNKQKAYCGTHLCGQC